MNFLVYAYFQIDNNFPLMLIQGIYELRFLFQIIKGTEKSFKFKLSTNLSTAFPLKIKRQNE